MAFQFNFPDPNVKNDSNILEELNETNCQEDSEDLSFQIPCCYVEPNIDHQLLKNFQDQTSFTNIGPYSLKHLSMALNHQNVSKSDIFELLEEKKTDLVPGVYEGGLKIWECSIDLAKFLEKNNCFTGKENVLELGCGVGIPGLLAYVSGCQLTFQDFNAEVLQFMTIPNVFLNTPEHDWENLQNACEFIAGDWQTIQSTYYTNETNLKKYDVILTSETIYEMKSHKKLLELMKCALNPNGVIYLAAKTHYFGVGGTIDDFETLVEEDGSFHWELVNNISEGIGRQIIKMKIKTS